MEASGSLWNVSGKLWNNQIKERAVRYLGEVLEGPGTSPEHSGTPWEMYKMLCHVSGKHQEAVGRLQKALGRLRTALEALGCSPKAPENSGTSLEGGHIYWRVGGLRMKGHLEYMLGCKGCILKAISRKASAECAKR